MQGILFNFIIFTGVFLLELARANNTCDITQVNTCALSILQSGVLQRFQNINETEMDKACDQVTLTLNCITTAGSTCDVTTLQDVEPVITAIEARDRAFCNEGFRCITIMRDCIKTEPEIEALLASSAVSLSGNTYCPATANVVKCFEEKVGKECHVIRTVRDSINGLMKIDQYCREANCTAQNECQGIYLTDNPKESGIDNRTCYMMANFTGCQEDVLTSCPDLKSPEGEPSPAIVGGMMEELCQLMGDSEVNALYRCPAFTRCVTLLLSASDAFSLPNQCRKLQGIIGCAVNGVQRCRAVAPESANTFIQAANQMALKASAMGCAIAEVHTAGCPEFQACKASMASSGPEVPYFQRCQAMTIFQRCTHNARTTCNITEPVVDNGDDNKPSLDNIAAINEKICVALEGQSVTTCQEYTDCMTNANLPLNDAGLMDTGTWCTLTAHSLQCVHFFGDKCPVPAPVTSRIHVLFAELMAEGCPNTYGYIIPDVTGATNTSRTTIATSAGTNTSQTTATSPRMATTDGTTASKRTTATAKSTTTQSSVSTGRNTTPKRTTHTDNTDNTDNTNNTDNTDNDMSTFKPPNNINITFPDNLTNMSDGAKPPDNINITFPDNTTNMSDGAKPPDNNGGTSDSVKSENIETSDNGAEPLPGANLMLTLTLAMAVGMRFLL